MALQRVECPVCRTPVLERTINQDHWTPCNGCSNQMFVEVFPALFRPQAAGQTGELLIVEGESTCFYHPAKKAVLPCEGCGRFLCALCDCDFNGNHFCPACLEAGKTKGKIKNLENERPLYDSLALMFAVLPVVTLVFWVFTIITAPVALVLAILSWNKPRSIVRRTRARLVLAIILAALQIGAWGFGIYMLISLRRG